MKKAATKKEKQRFVSIPEIIKFDEVMRGMLNDPVNHPSHYTSGKIEVIAFIEDQGFDYHLGQVIKYVSRAGKKSSSPLEDLKKAQWYLNRKISNLERDSTNSDTVSLTRTT